MIAFVHLLRLFCCCSFVAFSCQSASKMMSPTPALRFLLDSESTETAMTVAASLCDCVQWISPAEVSSSESRTPVSATSESPSDCTSSSWICQCSLFGWSRWSVSSGSDSIRCSWCCFGTDYFHHRQHSAGRNYFGLRRHCCLANDYCLWTIRPFRFASC